MLDTLPDGVLLDTAGTIRYANEAAARLFGVNTPRALLNKRYSDLILSAGPPGRARGEHHTLRRSDGRMVEVEAFTQALASGKSGSRQTVLRAISYPNPTRDSAPERLRLQAEVVSAAIVLDAIGDGGSAALGQAEEQLRQAQRMEAVGRLASGIAHDFNNLLTAIQGHAQFLTEDLAPEHPSRADVDEILHSSERAAALTRQLLAFSRGQSLQPETIQINHVVHAMERLLRRVISEDIAVESILDPLLWSVRADASQIEQILVNLIVNARDAMPRGGRITIKTANAELATSYAQRREEVEPGEYVMLAISDTGVGMDRDTQAHIFEPFFSTKEPDKGTGLGLSTVFGIIKQMNGHIYVYSEPGQGTTFKVYIPRAGTAQHWMTQPPEKRNRSRGEAVLIVEDDDSVRALARRVLEGRGYRVWLSSSAEDALPILHQYGNELSLLLTDVVLPTMDGKTLVQRAQEMWPQLGAIFMSGYTDDELRRQGAMGRHDHFLEKPFTPEALANKVRWVLDDLEVNPPRNQL
ncbi:MAG TPA: ATP-binding protein [Longimicrobiales bacterium]|nr:ATP-binding protein [Longimicrobiales bacterium]